MGVAVLLIGVAAAAVAPSPLAPTHTVPLSLPVGGEVRLVIGDWTSVNLSVTPHCLGCVRTVTTGSKVNLTLSVVPHCGAYGCAGPLRGATVPSPFRLLSVLPALPESIPASGTNLSVSLQAPAKPGSYAVNGSLEANGPPSPVVVTSQAWTLRNASGGNGQFTVSVNSTPLTAAPGALFNDTLYLNNSSPNYERIDNLSVAAPFVLVATGPGFPYPVMSNASGQVFAELRAPAQAGNYSISGALGVDLVPLVLVDRFVFTFSGGTGALSVTNISIPRQLLPGEESSGSLVIANGDLNASHAFAYQSLGGAFLFVNSTPNGTTVLGPGQSVRWYETVSAKGPYGSYTFALTFRQLY